MRKKEKREVGLGTGCSQLSGNKRRKCFPKEGSFWLPVTSKILHLSSQTFPEKRIPSRSEEGREIGVSLAPSSHIHCMVRWAGTVLSTRAENGKDAPWVRGMRSEPAP